MDFYTRELNLNNLWGNKKCKLCGRYFKDGEKGILLIPTKDCKHLIKSSIIMHSEEFKKVQSECGSKDELINKLANWKRPRVSETYSKKQLELADVFSEVAHSYNFKEKKVLKVKGLVRCKKVGSSDTLEYNIRENTISFFNNKRNHEINQVWAGNLIANIRTNMNELLQIRQGSINSSRESSGGTNE